jgi:hypothetical protein
MTKVSKAILISILAGMMFLCPGYLSAEEEIKAEEEVKLTIKHGMYEKTVNEEYGEPILLELIRDKFWPIPKKKALYRLGEKDYMILYFFSGRVSKISILSEMPLDQAIAFFNS